MPPSPGAHPSLAARAHDENNLVGSKVGEKYEILEIVGRGSMGIVYKARHDLIGKIVAIKMLRWQLLSDPRSKRRFEREAIASSRLEHPNIIAIYDFGLTPTNQPYIVMDFVQGTTLLNVLKEEKAMQPERGVKIFAQVADALHHAHTRGVIHRDLKPANVMLLEKNGQVDFVKVVDLGIAKIAFGEDEEPDPLTKTNEVCGSPLYLSPEQCKQQAMDPRSDMYSMGVVMYELLTGMPPLQGSTVYDTLYMHVHNKPARLSDVRPDLNIPKRLEDIVLRTLEKEPGDRFATMADLKRELELVFGYRHSAVQAVRVIPAEAILSAEMVRKLKIAEGEATPYLPLEALKSEAKTPTKLGAIASGTGKKPPVRPPDTGQTAAVQQAIQDLARNSLELEAVARESESAKAELPARKDSPRETSARQRSRRTDTNTVIPPPRTGPDTKTIVISIFSAVIATAITIGFMQLTKTQQPVQTTAPQPPPPAVVVPQNEIDNQLPIGTSSHTTLPEPNLVRNTHEKIRSIIPDSGNKPAIPLTPSATTPAAPSWLNSQASAPGKPGLPPLNLGPAPSVVTPTPTGTPSTPTGTPAPLAVPKLEDRPLPIPVLNGTQRAATTEDVQPPAPVTKVIKVKPAKVKTAAPPVIAKPKTTRPAGQPGSDGTGDAFFGIFQQGK
jgi:serine/threonine protein kinase